MCTGARCILNKSASAISVLTVLKKVCDHPALLSERATKLVLTGGSDVRGCTFARFCSVGQCLQSCEGSMFATRLSVFPSACLCGH
jgi:hypothetical protein